MPSKKPHIVYTEPIGDKGEYKIYSVKTNDFLGTIKGDNLKKYWEAFDTEGNLLTSGKRKKNCMDFFRDQDTERLMAQGGGIGNRVLVVLDEGNGKVINDLFAQWNNIKTETDQEKWSEKVKATTFGTYGNISINEVLDKFEFDKSTSINDILKKDFKNELNSALRYGKGGGVGNYGGGNKITEKELLDLKNWKPIKKSNIIITPRENKFKTRFYYDVENLDNTGFFESGYSVQGFSKKEAFDLLKNKFLGEDKFEKGGGIGFEKLSDKVAKDYEGDKVAPKYQHEYGKTYSKAEAKEVGDKVAGKVYWQQQGRKMATGGGIEEFKRKEIERQRKEEEGKTFAPYKAYVYENSPSGANQFNATEADSFIAAVKWAKEQLVSQRNYRKNSDLLWAQISKFVPVEERNNVIYPYADVATFDEEKIEAIKYANGGSMSGGMKKFYILLDDGTKKEYTVKHPKEISGIYFAAGYDRGATTLEKGLPMVHYDNALSPLYNADGTLVQAYPQYAGMDYNDLKSKMEDGGNVDEDYYRVFRNNAGKDIAVKIVKNPIFGNFDYYVDGSLRGSFDTFEQARKEVNYENFDMYKDGGSIKNGNYAFVEAETTTGKKVFKFFEDVPTHKEIYAYFRSIKDENGNPITLKDATIHIEKVSNFDRELFLEKANEIAIKQFGSPIEEIEDLMFAYDKENLSVFKFEAELENGMEVSIEATDGVIIIEAEKDEDDDLYKDGGTIYSKDESMNIAQTILSQMGGRRRLEAFTGAYNFAVGDGSVMFRIKNRKVNVVKVKLNGSDLYDVTFGRISGTNYKVVEELKDVYAEDLIDLFERETGMYLRMEKGGNLYDSEFYAKGGLVITSINDIPNFKEENEAGRITYRGLGMGKLSDDFYKIAGEGGTRIKVKGKEYFITDTEFNTFSRDSSGKMRIKFAAPFRKMADGGNL